MKSYITDSFLLQNKTAQKLYEAHAKDQPIFDYHCHLPVADIAEDTRYQTLAQVWLYGDHYKWRAMRANGIDERFCTGDATDLEKFKAWGRTVPYTLRNPLYHWTHLELKRYFDIDQPLNEETAEAIFEACNEKLNSSGFSTRNLLRMMNVTLVCTTEDPLDSLDYHKRLQDDDFEIAVRTAWRPDKAMACENPSVLNQWIDGLAALTNTDIGSFSAYRSALEKRHGEFHDVGCRLSDHGIETAYAEEYTESEIEGIFQKLRKGESLQKDEQLKFKSAMLYDQAAMDHAAGWVQQYHLGALRSVNSWGLQQLGPDTGFDSIGDFEQAAVLGKFLDRLESNRCLTRTILYNLNPGDNEIMATMAGNFQDGSSAGKMQFGAAWWFLDQKDGIEKHFDVLSNMGLLSRFVGMLTDSRSFLSFPRHEYFRRVLCNLLGEEIEKGLLPNDLPLVGRMVEDICYNNAVNYFGMTLRN
jgi:glucuronate isomerase